MRPDTLLKLNRNPEIHVRQERNPEVLASAPDEDLGAGTDITVSTREKHQGSHHNSRRVPFVPPHLEMRVHFPASLGKESQLSRHNSRGSGLNLKMRGTPGAVPPFQKSPMSQCTPDIPDSPALTGLSPRGSTQNMMARVTAQ